MKKIFMFFALGFACSPPRWLSYTRRKASVDRTHFKFPEHLGGTPSSLFSSRLLRSRVTVGVITINPPTMQMMVAASQTANSPQASAVEKIIAFARAAGTVVMLTVSPQSAKPRPH
jgi:hypothetical protein